MRANEIRSFEKGGNQMFGVGQGRMGTEPSGVFLL